MADETWSRLSSAPNPNHLWAAVVVEELHRNGVDTFCICPGSRSTPLAWAVAEHPSAQSVVHFDERGAAFHALGIAKATRKPTAFICTSGTAVANAYPAVVEAAMAHVPLILLTADRPPHLQNTGANQTIDQNNIFGGFVRWQIGQWGPADNLDFEDVLATVDQAVFNAKAPLPGPVQLNCMFDEPLAPVADPLGVARGLDGRLEAWAATGRPFTQPESSDAGLSASEISTLTEKLNASTKGLLLAGGLSTREESNAVERLAKALNWPVLADVTSGLRLRTNTPTTVHHAVCLLGSEAFRELLCEADTILHIGGPFVSKPMLTFQGGLNTKGGRAVEYIRVADHARSVDPPNRVTLRIACDLTAFCETMIDAVRMRPEDDWIRSILESSRQVDRCLNAEFEKEGPLSEPCAARMLTQSAPRDSVLYLGNSMPIRDADQYGATDGNGAWVAANRGASGIDGTIATAAGYARGLGKPVTALIGDLAALHDLNSLALLRDLGVPVILVIMNNDGGGIFHFLPIANHPKHFERLVGTPHGLGFEDLARAFGLPYCRPQTNADLREAYDAALRRAESCIIEIRTGREENLRLHRELDARIAATLKSS